MVDAPEGIKRDDFDDGVLRRIGIGGRMGSGDVGLGRLGWAPAAPAAHGLRWLDGL